MSEKLGIEELKPVVKELLNLGEAAAALSDGIGIGDVDEGFKVLVGLLPAISALRSGQVIPELKDLDDAEQAELLAFVDENFDLESDALESTVENILHVVIKLAAVIASLVAGKQAVV